MFDLDRELDAIRNTKASASKQLISEVKDLVKNRQIKAISAGKSYLPKRLMVWTALPAAAALAVFICVRMGFFSVNRVLYGGH